MKLSLARSAGLLHSLSLASSHSFDKNISFGMREHENMFNVLIPKKTHLLSVEIAAIEI